MVEVTLPKKTSAASRNPESKPITDFALAGSPRTAIGNPRSRVKTTAGNGVLAEP